MMYFITIAAMIGYILFTCKKDKEVSMSYRDYIIRKLKDALIVGSIYGLLAYIKEEDFKMLIVRMLVCIVTISVIKTISYILKNKLS